MKKYGLAAFLSFLFFSLLQVAGIFNYVENKFYDYRQRITAKSFKVDDDICFVCIDQNSLDWAKQEMGWGWPWPREAYGKIASFMEEGNAASLIFDIFFTENSVYGPQDDAAFASACKQNGRVVHTVYESNVTNFSLVEPVPVIKDSAAILGSSTSSKDRDDVIRRQKLIFNYSDKLMPALGAAPFFLDDEVTFTSVNEFLKKYSTVKDGAVNLRYKGEIDRYPHYSAASVLQYFLPNGDKELLPRDFKDAHVFVLLYAPGLFDICSTPINQVYPGAGVHITLLDNLLNNEFIINLPSYFNFLLILLGITLGFVNSVFLKRIKNYALFEGLWTVLIISCSFTGNMLFFKNGIYIQYVNFIFAFAFAKLIQLNLNYSVEHKKRKFIKSAFGQYLSPKVIDLIITNPDKLRLGGERRNITIFFSDIENFTGLSESLAPEQLTDLLNEYLSTMTNIILKNGGTIDKYEGDAIIAFWNAPADQKNHSVLAVKAALECQEKLTGKKSEYYKRYGHKLNTRIGINTGDAVVGNMGSTLRFDYTIIGDSVNLASRLEGLNKSYGTYLMCSENTKLSYEAEEEENSVYWQELGAVRVVGKSLPVKIFKPVSKLFYEQNKSYYLNFQRGIKAFYSGNFNLAIDIFNSLNTMESKKYIEKCEYLRNLVSKGELEQWTGVWSALKK